VFVKLTGGATPEAIRALVDSGLAPPAGEAAPTTWPSIKTVAGLIRGDRIDAIASLEFVTRIEPSADARGIAPSSP
jgi:hypothetical protein